MCLLQVQIAQVKEEGEGVVLQLRDEINRVRRATRVYRLLVLRHEITRLLAMAHCCTAAAGRTRSTASAHRTGHCAWASAPCATNTAAAV